MKLPKESRGLAAAVIGKLDDKIIVLTSKDHPKSILLKAAPSGRRDKRADIVISLTSKEEIIGVVVTQARAANGYPTPEAVEAEKPTKAATNGKAESKANSSADGTPKASANGKAEESANGAANGTEHAAAPKAKASANGKAPKPA
jgi:hypothetical protein